MRILKRSLIAQVRNGDSYERNFIVMVTITISSLRYGAKVLRGLPVNGEQGREVVLVAHCGQTGEHVLHVRVRVFAVALTGDDDRVDDGRSLSGVRVSDEQPVLFPNGGGPDGIFNEVVIQSGLAVLEMRGERCPLVEQVGAGFAQVGTWQDLSAFAQPLGELFQCGERTDVSLVAGASLGTLSCV